MGIAPLKSNRNPYGALRGGSVLHHLRVWGGWPTDFPAAAADGGRIFTPVRRAKRPIFERRTRKPPAEPEGSTEGGMGQVFLRPNPKAVRCLPLFVG